MRVLLVAAHPDDEVLGIGGTVKLHSLKGDEVYGVILGEGITARCKHEKQGESKLIEDLRAASRKSAEIIGYKELFFEQLPDNRFDSVEMLDIVKILEGYIARIKPEIIYTHHFGDINIDHRITFDAVLTATRPIGHDYTKEIYSFETVSSTEWNFKSRESLFKPNVFVDITEVLDFKLKALECYQSEMREYPHPRSIEGVEICAKKWGTVVSREYVEALEAVRIVR
ncbi:MAG: PIG-L family deacetylase [Clostridia bacterium]|nr:PIG-L family deacetylase [Clostridia bacterium]